MNRIFIIAVAVALGFGLATTASADVLTVGDSHYLGLAVDGAPASADWEVAYINYLIGLSPNGTGSMPGPGQQIEFLYRSPNDFGMLPTAVTAGAINGSSPTSLPINTLGWTYLLGKYGGWSHVWFVAGLESAEIPAITSGSPGAVGTSGISHYSRYNYNQVPDGGTTLMLLGGALIGVGILRRRLSA